MPILRRKLTPQEKFRSLLKMRRKEAKQAFKRGDISYSDYKRIKKDVKIMLARTRPGIFGRYMVADVDSAHLKNILGYTHGMPVDLPKGTSVRLYYRPFSRVSSIEKLVMSRAHGVSPPVGKIGGAHLLHSIMTEDIKRVFGETGSAVGPSGAPKSFEGITKPEEIAETRPSEDSGSRRPLLPKEIIDADKLINAIRSISRKKSSVVPQESETGKKWGDLEPYRAGTTSVRRTRRSRRSVAVNARQRKLEQFGVRFVSGGKTQRALDDFATPKLKETVKKVVESSNIEGKPSQSSLDNFGLNEVKVKNVVAIAEKKSKRKKRSRSTKPKNQATLDGFGQAIDAIKRVEKSNEPIFGRYLSARLKRNLKKVRPTLISRVVTRQELRVSKPGKNLKSENSKAKKAATSFEDRYQKLVELIEKSGFKRKYSRALSSLSKETDEKKKAQLIRKIETEVNMRLTLKKHNITLEHFIAFFGVKGKNLSKKRFNDLRKDYSRMKVAERFLKSWEAKSRSGERMSRAMFLKAKQSLETLDVKYERHFYTKFLLGKLYEVAGRTDEARKYYEEAEKLLGKRVPKELKNYKEMISEYKERISTKFSEMETQKKSELASDTYSNVNRVIAKTGDIAKSVNAGDKVPTLEELKKSISSAGLVITSPDGKYKHIITIPDEEIESAIRDALEGDHTKLDELHTNIKRMKEIVDVTNTLISKNALALGEWSKSVMHFVSKNAEKKPEEIIPQIREKTEIAKELNILGVPTPWEIEGVSFQKGADDSLHFLTRSTVDNVKRFINLVNKEASKSGRKIKTFQGAVKFLSESNGMDYNKTLVLILPILAEGRLPKSLMKFLK